RITPTRTLATALRQLGDDAPHFVSASGAGYYGSAPGAKLDESSPRGTTFLADLCGEWETAAFRSGAPTAFLRTAPVVHRHGVLKPLVLLTRAGLSGPLGRGTQVWPWISLDDAVRAIRHIIGEGLTGPVNLPGPERATANDLGFALAREPERPYLPRAPPRVPLTGLSPHAADSLLLTDAHVVPAALTGSGFAFTHATVEAAVQAAVTDR